MRKSQRNRIYLQNKDMQLRKSLQERAKHQQKCLIAPLILSILCYFALALIVVTSLFLVQSSKGATVSILMVCIVAILHRIIKEVKDN